MKNFNIFFIIFILCFSIKIYGLLIGGWSDMDTSSAKVKELAKKVLDKYNTEQKENNTLNKIIKAKQQVVAGMKYNITILISPSSKSASNCLNYLEATIFEQPWTKTENITIYKKPTENKPTSKKPTSKKTTTKKPKSKKPKSKKTTSKKTNSKKSTNKKS
ncbi:Proteinase inhibitor I25, cystatin domain-containing protein [Strongyloides ratti]|uniref:Proteinase inhibitor I25, cystatin domain-containing protein n=1 Tax=Strongyloides ratti TaxID=34506 RepID=A0A090LQ75_STRRB|nr:Proteinase inhibitor I25, cystatin domain-containing protein [Strongyloides ratti]CEF70324.2 Proteinase inhibitor I25, cystatin domain-containing protein [Strongyloides ratti]